MQTPPQSAKPASQSTWQPPATQAALPLAGASHAFSQLPQCRASVLVSTQAAPQAVRPGPQLIPHWALWQVATPPVGTEQRVSQSPQCSGEL
jgi:hypothetical protein